MGFEVDQSGRSYYHPRAFYIHLRSELVNEDGTPNRAGFPIFMHEYAHLIQDRCSIFGVVDFVHFTDSVHSLLQLLHSAAKPIALPLAVRPDASTSWLAEIETIRRIANPLKGWKNGVNWAYETHEVKKAIAEYTGDTHEFPVVIGRFADNATGDTYEHEIGPREVKEAYSTAVEVLHGGVEVDSPTEFQYLAVERMLARYGINDHRHRLTICHWALQDTFPGVRLCEILSRVETLSSLPSPEELYDLCRLWASESGYNSKLEIADRQLAEIVTNQRGAGEDDLYYKVLKWYYTMAMKSLRLNMAPERRFPLDTLLGTPRGAPIDALAKLFIEQPIPFLETSDSRIYGYGGSEEGSNMVFFVKCCVAALERLWYLDDTSWKCPLYDTCDPARIPHKDDECLVKPWHKGAYHPACAYGAVAKYFGLTDSEFTRAAIGAPR